MTIENKCSEGAGELSLRKRAEAALRKRDLGYSKGQNTLSPEDSQKLIYELRVHQIELELQNEELRRMQVELDASRARYFSLYDLAPVGYCALSSAGMILQANLNTALLLGVAKSRLHKRLSSNFIFKDDRDLFNQLCRHVLKSGESETCRLRLVRNDLTKFWAQMHITAAHDGDGYPELRLVFSDDTEAVIAQEAKMAARKEAEQFKELFQSIVEVSPISLSIWDLDLETIRFINPQVKNVLGYTEDEINSKDSLVQNIVHSEDRGLIISYYEKQRTLDDAELAEVCCRWKHKDGGWRYLCNTGAIFRRDATGRITHTINTTRAITGLERNFLERV